MPFDAYDRSVDLLHSLRPLFPSLAASDTSLTDQLRRAASSVVLNLAEANERTQKDRRNRFRIALGSAAEVAACLEVAIAFGYLERSALEAQFALIDRVRAMTYRLSKK